MYKKIIKFKDLEGNENTKECLFNISKFELLEMQISKDGGFDKLLNKIINEQNPRELVSTFKDIIRIAYGEKSQDGTTFIKIDENGHRLADRFIQSEAFSEFFMEMVTDADAASDFIKKIMPSEEELQEIANRLNKQQA